MYPETHLISMFYLGNVIDIYYICWIIYCCYSIYIYISLCTLIAICLHNLHHWTSQYYFIETWNKSQEPPPITYRILIINNILLLYYKE